MKNNFLILSYYFESEDPNSYMSGPSVDYYKFLKGRSDINSITYFRFPLINKNKSSEIIIEEFKNNKVSIHKFKFKKITNYQYGNQKTIETTIYKIHEIYFILKYIYFGKFKKKYNVIWTTESTQLLSSLIFKIFNTKTKIVYDVIDFSPRRFPNKFKNHIFHFLDFMACKLANYSVVQTPRIVRYRKKKFNLSSTKHIIKPSGVDIDYFRENTNDFDEFSIVYAGVITETEGLDLILDIMPDLISYNNNIKLKIIGSSQDQKYLDDFLLKIELMNLGDHIVFKGQINDKSYLADYLEKQSLSIALYRNIKNEVSNKFFNSVNKLHVYSSCSLPIVTTYKPYFGSLIEKHNAGFRVSYNKNILLKNIIKYFDFSIDEKIQMRKNSFNLSKLYSWNKIYEDITNQII